MPYHNSTVFSQISPLHEWLIYFRYFYRTFSIWIISEDEQYEAKGKYCLSGPRELSIRFEGFGKPVELDLKPETSRYSSPLVADILMAGEKTGVCRVQNDQPVIQITNRTPDCWLEAHRTHAKLVECPMLIFGIRNCEMVLEPYHLLDKDSKRGLPNNELTRHFAGSCRNTAYLANPLTDALEGIGMLVAINGLLVGPHYMSV